MKTVRDLHEEAMRLAQLATIAQFEGRVQDELNYARQATEFEAGAATMLEALEENEPTRSILFRSAASLAMQANNHELALRLVYNGLAGIVPDNIKSELTELLERIHFESFRSANANRVNKTELVVSLTGDVIYTGAIILDEILKRFTSFRDILLRIAQRKKEHKYEDIRKIKNYYNIVLADVRQGSFEFVLKIVEPKQQTDVFNPNAPDIINEFIEDVNLLNNSKYMELRDKINNDDFYYNFISLTKEFAPDGKRIRSLSIASSETSTMFIKNRSELSQAILTDEKGESEFVKKIGVLDFADRRKSRNLALTTDENERIFLEFRGGLDDVVKSYFGEWVQVSGQLISKDTIKLQDIDSYDEPLQEDAGNRITTEGR